MQRSNLSEQRSYPAKNPNYDLLACFFADFLINLTMSGILLIYPPLVKACEPPIGIARLAAAMQQHGVVCETWDANLEGQLALLHTAGDATDPRLLQAVRTREHHLFLLRDQRGYENFDRYKLAVNRLNYLLASAGQAWQSQISLADYTHSDLQPVRSSDLLRIAEEPQRSPFYDVLLTGLQNRIKHRSFAYVGLSINYLSQALSAFAIVGILKTILPQAGIIAGGGLITSWLRRPGWRNRFSGLIDHLVEGPGEQTLAALLAGQDTSCGIPMPDYSGFMHQSYFAPGAIIPYSTSFGCHWNRCAFCPEKAEGQKYQPVAADQVRTDLTTLVLRYKPILLHLTDNSLSPKILRLLADHPPEAPWYGFTRITPALAEPDMAHALHQAGCRMLKLGVESGDARVLQEMHKGHTPELAERVLRNLNAAGIATFVYLLFGTPWEDEHAAQATLQFVERNHQAITFINPALFNMPIEPETNLRPFYGGDLSLYTAYDHASDWSRQHVRHFFDRVFRRHPAVADILRRTPPAFTSNHAPFFSPLWLTTYGHHPTL